MPAWEDYKATARSRGALALELFVVRTRPIVPGPELQETLPRHLAYQQELEAAGSLAFAGPVSDETGEQMLGEGMIIYRAASLADARTLADADPMHAEGKRAYEIRRWLINEGSFNLGIRLSAQAADFG